MINSNENPCLADTGHGFSVSYNGRFLYSKYNPSGSILKLISNTDIRPDTLVLCFSAVLDYGFKELLEKLSPGSFIIAIEKDRKLFEFFKEHTDLSVFEGKNIDFMLLEDEKDLPSIILRKQKDFHFRRVLPLDMSAATSFSSDFYKTITAYSEKIISQFWKNRITLVKMGRLYAKNILRNIGKINKSYKIIPASVKAPVMVIGAGPSADYSIEIIKKYREKLFIIAVDVALKNLLDSGIIPDAAVVVESQLAIEKAFIGTGKEDIVLFADLTSRPQLTENKEFKVSYFLSDYENISFLDKVSSDFDIPLIEPLGSVGIVAMKIALLLRADDYVPVFYTGLDFSFFPEKSHCNEAPAIIQRQISSTRLKPLLNVDGAYREDSRIFTDKQGLYVTNKALSDYAENFSLLIKDRENIYDIGQRGFFLCRNHINDSIFSSFIEQIENKEHDCHFFEKNKTEKEKTADFLKTEEKAILKIKDILLGKDSGDILSNLEGREYLYLHFADGYKKPTEDVSFLKRLRSELDFFLKYIHNGQNNISD